MTRQPKNFPNSQSRDTREEFNRRLCRDSTRPTEMLSDANRFLARNSKHAVTNVRRERPIEG
jgi:hypothetical protein